MKKIVKSPITWIICAIAILIGVIAWIVEKKK